MTTRRAAALALTAALASPAVPATAQDASHLRFLRGCQFSTVAQDATWSGYVGVMYAHVLAYSVSPEHNPVTVISIGCELRVNGVAVASTARWPGAGPVGVVPPQVVEFAASDTDDVDLCTLIDVVDAQGGEHSLTRCPGPTTLPFPPPWVTDLLNDVFTIVDGTVCPALVAAAPYLPPPVEVGDDGDVYVAGELWWDCPPYV